MKFSDKKFIYIAAPYTSSDTVLNIHNAIFTAGVIMKAGPFIPFVPHLYYSWHLIDPMPYDFWADLGLRWLERCDCVFRLGGESPGADTEVTLAKMLDIPVVYSITELKKLFAE